jgi:hypothetical protein
LGKKLKGGESMIFIVKGLADYRYVLNAPTKEAAIEQAQELFNSDARLDVGSYAELLEWEARPESKEK